MQVVQKAHPLPGVRVPSPDSEWWTLSLLREIRSPGQRIADRRHLQGIYDKISALRVKLRVPVDIFPGSMTGGLVSRSPNPTEKPALAARSVARTLMKRQKLTRTRVNNRPFGCIGIPQLRTTEMILANSRPRERPEWSHPRSVGPSTPSIADPAV